MEMMVGKLQQIITLVWVSLCLLYFIFISFAVSLQIASTLSPMATGDASQTTPVQIKHAYMFSCCVLFNTDCTTCAILILISVRVFTCYTVCIN